MQLTRHRTHKVNMTNYENVEFGASATLEVGDDADLVFAVESLNKTLDLMLAEDMTEALANIPEDAQQSHVETWRK